MIEPTPPPSTLRKAGAIAAKWLLGLLVSAWITVALVWGGLHFLIVPRIGELRPWLEQQASKALGVTVQIGAITARSNGLIPSVEFSDIRLLDAQGREALRLPSVLTALSPRSAFGMGFEQIYIEGLVLEVRRTADGRIWVAGFALPQVQDDDGSGADWVFSQTELAIRHGTVHWTDEARGAPPLVLSDVDVVLRNRNRSHALRVDATPPPEWGARMSASGMFRQSLLSHRAGQWKEWDGQLYADLPQVDLAQLRRYADLGVDVAQGAGAVRVWADLAHGVFKGAAADVALNNVNVRVDPRLDALALASVAGRLGVRVVDGGMEYSTQALAFDMQDGAHWPGGNVKLALYRADAHNAAHGELTADRLDLAAMAQIAARLPLAEASRKALAGFAPKGLVEQVQASWQGPAGRYPERFAVKGRVTQLEIAAQHHEGGGTPGVQGADIDFDINQANGKATVALRGGMVDLPGVFEDPQIRFDQLNADVQWKLDGEQISVTVPNLRFSNADAEGQAEVKWQTGSTPAHKGRFPGLLELDGTLSRAEGVRVQRYLPLELDHEVRDYLREAVLGGTASGVKFRLKGNLADFPYTDPRQGDFRISANVQNASFAYVPASLMPKDSPQWPALRQISGELVIDHALLQVKDARATLAGAPNLQISKAEAAISSLYHNGQLAVSVEAKGPLTEALGFVNSSPLGPWTGKVLAHASATGVADYRVKLALPILAPERATVQGSVVLAGNDVQIAPDMPRLQRARGQLGFSETGFTVTGGQARVLGGDMRIDGGLSMASGAAAQKTAPPTLRMQGTATADGVRQARELGLVARLGQYASGSTTYTATLGLRGGLPELQVNSPLTGMALNLPAPFAKTADMPLPLHLETGAVRTATGILRSQDQWQLDVGRLASATYVRDISGPEAKVLRGSIAVGLAADESAPLPSEGVAANINLNHLDVDAWGQIVSGTPGNAPAAGSSLAGMAYLPTSFALRAKELLMGGRQINNVVVGGGRDGMVWRANLDATELSGYGEYRQPVGAAAGRLYARLARLAIGQGAAQEVENLLDEQPASIPALDVVVEDFELRGKKLGRVEMDAVNLGAGVARDVPREWRLNHFNITTPEAVLTASGNWTNINAQGGQAQRRSIRERRRTVMNFKLDINDAGQLLERFGMSGVVRKGHGKVEGQVAWQGSPITLDYPSLSGNFNVNVETGQFLKADPGIAKLLGVLSLQSLPRRLTLDFRDVFSEGFAFDFFRGDIAIEQGIARTSNLQMKGVNAAVLMDGQTDIAKETQAIKVVVVPEINAGSASLIASAVNPLVGLSTFLAQVLLRGPLIQAATQELFIDGTWVDPRVTKVERKTTPAASPAKPEESK